MSVPLVFVDVLRDVWGCVWVFLRVFGDVCRGFGSACRYFRSVWACFEGCFGRCFWRCFAGVWGCFVDILGMFGVGIWRCFVDVLGYLLGVFVDWGSRAASALHNYG